MTGNPTAIVVASDDPGEVLDPGVETGWTVDVVTGANDLDDPTLAGADAAVVCAPLSSGSIEAVCERIVTRRPTLPLVIFDESADPSLAGAAVAAGADGYVPACDGPAKLFERLDVLCDPGARDRYEGALAETTTLIDAVGDGLYALDREGRFLAVNDALEELTGYDRSELLGSPVEMVLSEADYELALAEIRQLVEEDPDGIATYSIDARTADGGAVPCEVTTTVLLEEHRYAGSIGIVRDVSERVAMEAVVADRQHKIETLHEVAQRFGDCETIQQVFELTVETAEDVLEFDVCVADLAEEDRLVTKAISSDMHEEGYQNVSDLEEGLAGKTYLEGETFLLEDVYENEEAIPEREEYKAAISAPIRDWGVFQAVSTEYGAFDEHDVELTELLLAHAANALDRIDFEQRLVEERDRFAALFENVPDAVVNTEFTEGGPTVRSVNPAFEDVFGYEAEEIVGARLDEYIVPVEHETGAASINRLGRQGEIVEREVKRRTAEGIRDFMLRVVPVDPEEDTTHGFGVYTDITEQKQRQKRVEILNRVLRHDLRNGMNIIRGSAEMLEEVVEDEHEAYAEAIQERAGELLGMAETTRAVERTLDRDAASGPVDVVDAIEIGLDHVEGRAEDLEVEVDGPEYAYARADDLLREAITHVIENAVDHNDRETVEIAIDVSLEGPEGNGDLVVEVADNGPGIPEDERALLQEDEEITQLRHASGLGLWLVNWVVTQSGGILQFEDNEPRGTVVVLRLPRAEPPAAERVSDGATAGD